MCLVLKLDNGKVVSIADEQTHRWTEPPSTVLVYRLLKIERLRLHSIKGLYNYTDSYAGQGELIKRCICN